MAGGSGMGVMANRNQVSFGDNIILKLDCTTLSILKTIELYTLNRWSVLYVKKLLKSWGSSGGGCEGLNFGGSILGRARKSKSWLTTDIPKSI